MPRTLVSTEGLAAHLENGWAIVDCRFDLQQEALGYDQYLAGHIPSALYAHLSKDLAGSRTARNGRHPLPSIDQMASTFGGFGISPGTQVIVYDQDAGMYASRLWWMLRYLGHEAVAVLDGGWAKWVREGRPMRSGVESRAAAAFRATPRPELVAGIADVEAVATDAARLLVDARAPERFEGQSETIDRVAGHIPGAVNHFFRKNVTAEGTMLSADSLRASIAQTLGDHAPAGTIMYCGSGVTACHNLLAMEHAGLPGAKLYPGSWSEWSSDPDRPVATGPA